MSEQKASRYQPEQDPEMMKYWMKQGPKTAAFLLVIPGCTLMGWGAGMLMGNPMAWGAIGLGAGAFAWGLVVALSK